MDRPDWDSYFMEIAEVVSKRSTCLRRKVGAVLVKDRQILATGYNGTPKGLPHCEQVGCLREKLHVPSGQNHELCRGIHAEQNAVIQAAVPSRQPGGSRNALSFRRRFEGRPAVGEEERHGIRKYGF